MQSSHHSVSIPEHEISTSRSYGSASAARNGAALFPVGLRILIVEDEMIPALDLSEIVEAYGCLAIIATRVVPAVLLVANQVFDAAILDINVSGEAVYPVADELAKHRTPFVFATGYGVESLSETFRKHPIMGKPYSALHVEAALSEIRRASGH
ncbi:MAG: response regulator [Micropepsaceae bacterium]